jgi:hypothetical protein
MKQHLSNIIAMGQQIGVNGAVLAIIDAQQNAMD